MLNRKKRIKSISSRFQKEISKLLKKKKHILTLHSFDFSAYQMREAILKNPLDFANIFLASLIITIVISTLCLLLVFNKIELGFSAPSFSLFTPGTVTFRGSSSKVISRFDPFALATLIKKNDHGYTLVDVRSKEVFENAHIKTAVSVPVFNTSIIQKDGSVNARMVNRAFSNIMKTDKIIILYGDSAYSQYPLDVASVLGNERVKVLAVGFNEWAHLQSIWVPEKYWGTFNPADLVQGKE